ncbi:MAG: hypothetical protein ABFD79_15860 [Phycisphaerales bacterium]
MWKKEISLIESKLRSLSNIDVPMELENKLISQIPGGISSHVNIHNRLRFISWILSSAAAAVFMIGVFIYQPARNRVVADPIAMPCSFSIVEKIADNNLQLPQILYNEPNL